MKKKILALVCTVVLSAGMSMTAFASGSRSAPVAAEAAEATQAVTAASFTVGGGQTFTESTLTYFAQTTTVAGGEVKAVNTQTVQEAIAQANAVYGTNTFIATVVDINVPGATFPYSLTISCPDVWAYQEGSVTVLHKVGENWERLTPSAVGNNSVTVTVNSFSPFALVVDQTATSPKTMDFGLLAGGLTAVFGAGAVLTRKKEK